MAGYNVGAEPLEFIEPERKENETDEEYFARYFEVQDELTKYCQTPLCWATFDFDTDLDDGFYDFKMSIWGQECCLEKAIIVQDKKVLPEFAYNTITNCYLYCLHVSDNRFKPERYFIESIEWDKDHFTAHLGS